MKAYWASALLLMSCGSSSEQSSNNGEGDPPGAAVVPDAQFASTTDAPPVDNMPPMLSNAHAHAAIGPSVARVEFVGTLHNGEKDYATGSAFVISRDGFVLTCKHVIPKLSNYKQTSIQLRFGAKAASPQNAAVEWVSAKHDIVVLRFLPPIPPALPLANVKLAIGRDIQVIGFPLSFDINVQPGIVSGGSGDGRFVINAPINAGYSGAPVIGPRGYAVGVTWGAAESWNLDGTVTPVHNAGFFIAMDDVLSDLPAIYRDDMKASYMASVQSHTGKPLPGLIRRGETVSFTKSDHPVVLAPHRRRFEKVFAPDPGYRIINATASIQSSNHASPPEIVLKDGRAIVASELTSGPAVDRYRAWLVATIQLEQRRD